MRLHKIISLIGIACVASALVAEAQKKPTTSSQNTTGQARVAPQRKAVTPSQIQVPLPGQLQPASDEKNKAVVRRVFDDLFTRGRYEFINDIYTKDCAVHFRGRNNRLEEAVAEGKGWRSAAPDLVMKVDSMVVQRDFVMVDWTALGTNTGKGNGVPASGKRILIHGNSKFRLVNGKIAEVWNEYDRDEIFRQVGVSPKIGHLYDMTQDYWSALNRMVSDSALAVLQFSLIKL